MIEKILAGALMVSISGCSIFDIKSLTPRNLIKTGSTTAVTYMIAGPIPAFANLATSVAVDEVLPEPEPEINDIEAGNKEQMIAYITQNITTTILYVIIGFLAFTTVIGPWAADRRRKRKMKYDAMKAELTARRLNDGTQ
ncbi:MAG: hypothetical protein CMD98_06435 [Gammaproteobacteria bacterium]|nr:hypothetical protein [Gammaproteobacteria bacterium]|tara:strand:+ start:3114 stop:3533 length:420 start_codon:yes stop_codon:yes gene_type:complete